jgi:hypothetical protein
LKGALTGAVGAGVVPEIAGIATGMGLDPATAKTVASGLVRGVSAELSGGSFAAGAASAALEHVYGMVASETGVPIAAVKAIGSAAGIPTAVNKAVGGGKPAAGTAAAPSKEPTPFTGFSNAQMGGIAGTLAVARAAQQRKEQDMQAAQTIKPTDARDPLDGQFAGGGMVKRFDGFGTSAVEWDPSWWESTNEDSGPSSLTNEELGLIWGDDSGVVDLINEMDPGEAYEIGRAHV